MNDGGSAFPFTPSDRSGQTGPVSPGMSLREWFAGMALKGLCSNHQFTMMSPVSIVKKSYEIADAMVQMTGEKS